ncbi:DNA replication complex GINS protein PSF1 isoform X2 [Phoenix dactylifera]|uniref:DNA replication complex GINS protein PSF1 isoform X2 n=1 Tax=Phoenix dactylifera TaxID=42345 RepID=A0A8B8J9G2_PHODC|nr:DNA replication complex GINS protein PSF1 isoform X2 [Phoenix dactylifera]
MAFSDLSHLWHRQTNKWIYLIMYGRRASQLLRELACSETGQLTTFNSDAFDQVIKECNEHNLQLQSLIRKIEDENLDIQTTRNEDHFGAVIHHLSLIRNKHCLMAYMYNRAETIQSLRWKVGPVLPQEIQEKLNYSEEEYFKNHSAAIESYMSELDLDLTVDMVPPKDPYIRVRVLDDIGEVCLGDHSISLTKHSLHFLRRTDAEPFISQGIMEEFLE